MHPTPVAQFYAQYWEQKPLHISRKASDYYANVFGTDDIRALFASKGELMLRHGMNVFAHTHDRMHCGVLTHVWCAYPWRQT